MGCEVAVEVAVPEVNGACASEAVELTNEEWAIIRMYRGLQEHDQIWMRRMISALAARTVPC